MSNIFRTGSLQPRSAPFVEKARALLGEARARHAGRIVFIGGAAGSGRSLVLAAIDDAMRTAGDVDVLRGSFDNGQYKPTDSRPKERTAKETVSLILNTLSFGAKTASPDVAAVVEFVEHLFEISTGAYTLAKKIAAERQSVPDSPDVLKQVLREAARNRPLVCVIDGFDNARGSWWFDLLQSFAGEINKDLPLLLFLTIERPEDLAVRTSTESDRVYVTRRMVERGLAQWWRLTPVDAEELQVLVGPVEADVASRVLDATGGNLRWIDLLWTDWRTRDIVSTGNSGAWRFTPGVSLEHEQLGTVNDIVGARIRRTLATDDPRQLDDAIELLAWAALALDGDAFVAEVLAQARQRDPDALVDYLDDVLVRTDTRVDGALVDGGSVTIGPAEHSRTLWRYRFVSDLYALVLRKYHFTDQERRDASAAIALAMANVFAADDRPVARTLAKLYAEAGDELSALRYRQLAEFQTSAEMLQWNLAALQAIPQDDWNKADYARAAGVLIEVGLLMRGTHPFTEIIKVLKRAYEMAVRSEVRADQARALRSQGDVYLELSDYRSTFQSYRAALRLSEESGDDQGCADALDGLGLVALHDHEVADTPEQKARLLRSAEKSFLDAMALLPSSHNGALRIRTWTGLGEVDMLRGNLPGARDKFTKALSAAQQIGTSSGEAHALRKLASVDQEEGHFDAADAKFQQALGIYRRLGDILAEGHVWLEWSNLDSTRGDMHGALVKGTKFLEIHSRLRGDVTPLPPSPFK